MATLSYIETSKLIGFLVEAEKRGQAYVRIVPPNQLVLGHDPLVSTEILDLSHEVIAPYPKAEESKSTSTESQARQLLSNSLTGRRRGQYWIEIKGRRYEVYSIKEVLMTGLRALQEEAPGTLARLSEDKPRSRRIVARSPELLFDKKHLVGKYSERLMDGWWVGTNNSAHETVVWLRRAASHAGLTWGVDVRTNLDLVPTPDDMI